MRRFLPLLIGITVTLLAGCESKREICARYAAGEIGWIDAAKDLGLTRGKWAMSYEVNRYCEYYKS